MEYDIQEEKQLSASYKLELLYHDSARFRKYYESRNSSGKLYTSHIILFITSKGEEVSLREIKHNLISRNYVDGNFKEGIIPHENTLYRLLKGLHQAGVIEKITRVERGARSKQDKQKENTYYKLSKDVFAPADNPHLDVMSRISSRYKELDIAIKMLRENGVLNPQEAIKRRLQQKHNIDETGTVMFPLPDDDDKEMEDWEKYAIIRGAKPGDIVSYKGNTSTYTGEENK